MDRTRTRRDFLRASSAALGTLLLPSALPPAPATGDEPLPRDDSAKEIRVVVWDEQQPAQKKVYENFLGNQIAEHLRSQPGLSVQSVKLDDPEQGLSASVLDGCRVLIWWGHVRQDEVAPETGKKIVERIQAGTLALIALHSAHWSTPFVEAMNERTRMVEHALRTGVENKVEITYAPPPRRYIVPRADERVTPYVSFRKFPNGLVKATVHLPYCCFPAYRNDGKPSYVRILRPDHPVVAGIPQTFDLPQTEMYDEPFHVPEPDEVILEERWASGEWFRSGMVWKLGKGRIFYFRPGHETFPIYKNPIPLRIVTNAVRWLAS